jgi:GAF domain-containing protein
VIRRSERPTATAADAPVEAAPQQSEQPEVRPIEISPNDPIVAYFQSASGAVDLDELELDSPALAALREAGVKLAVPLVSQGELVGLLNLGPRLSDQDYSSDDRKLLDWPPRRRRHSRSRSSCAARRRRRARASGSSRSSGWRR